MSYWIKSDPTKGKIISINKNKVQLKEGSTVCSGTFKTASGFEEWVGEVSNTSEGQIGFAKVK